MSVHNEHRYTPFDRLLMHFDTGLRTLCGRPVLTGRANPATAVADTTLTPAERRLSGRLMRINHAGEVAAQGLYEGQSLTAKLPNVRDKMRRAAQEENDHLAWCEQRVHELGTHVSYLGPLWYSGSLALGTLAGLAGDKWSLGFVVETERQVVRHLDAHLGRLSVRDNQSRAILAQMKIDETHHATLALSAGGAPLPAPIKAFMGLTSRIMTRTAYWF